MVDVSAASTVGAATAPWCDGGVFRQPQMEGGGVVLGQPKVGVLNWGNKEIGGDVVFKGRVLLSFACQKMKGCVL